MSESGKAGAPAQCAAGCGFYAAASSTYCSVCSKKFGSVASPVSAPSPVPAVVASVASTSSSAVSVSPVPAAVAVSGPSGGAGGSVHVAPASICIAPAASPLLSSSAGTGAAAAMPPTGAASPAGGAGGATPVGMSPALGSGAAGGAPPAMSLDGGVKEKEKEKEKAGGAKRCGQCKKKVGLTGFDCRCGIVFCGMHRYADQHGCTFDYRSHDRAVLEKANQKVVADKVEKL